MACNRKEIQDPNQLTVKIEAVEHGAPTYRNEARQSIEEMPPNRSTSYLPNQSPRDTSRAQSSLPFAPKEANYRIYNSASEIEYTPENALEEGVEMIKDVSYSLQGIELRSKLRKDVWMKEVETLLKEKTPRTMVAVCGATGAGKSSLLNAVLDDNIVPTSGSRACTAVITEISYHEKKCIEADISFLSMDEWRSELKVLLHDMADEDASLQNISNMRSDAVIARSKVLAVYPHITQQQLLNMTPDQIILSQPETAKVLGTKMKVMASDSEKFSEQIEKYVDSKKKKGGSNKDRRKDKDCERERKKNEDEPTLWPLIRLVQIRCHSESLSKGAILVDLPGVSDANAARNSIAKDYMKNCECIWIVAPITRAIDDKTAKELLGDAFKTQLLNGNYDDNCITFVATKTDDVSCSEIVKEYSLDDEPALQETERKIIGVTEKVNDLKLQKDFVGSRVKALEKKRKLLMKNYSDARRHLKALRNGEQYVSVLKKKKGKGKAKGEDNPRKLKASGRHVSCSTKCQRGSFVSAADSGGEFHGFSDDDEIDSNSDFESNSWDESDGDRSFRGNSDAGSDASGDEGSGNEDSDAMDEDEEQVTESSSKERIKNLKEQLKPLRKEVKDLLKTKKKVRAEIGRQKTNISKLQKEKNAFCSLKRNENSLDVLKEDFRQGLRQLDEATEEEKNPDTYDPSVPLRDYQAINLPVFTCSSRDYIRITKQVKGDGDPSCFTERKDTGIPDLQRWCHGLTVSSRERVARNFLAHLSTFLQSITSYVSDIDYVSVQDRIALRDRWETKGSRAPSDRNPVFTFSDFGFDVNSYKDPYSYMKELQEERRDQQEMNALPDKSISVRLQMEFWYVTKENVSQLKEKFRNALEERCTYGARKAQNMAVDISDNFAASMHWLTYRATLRKLGDFRRDLNLELVAPLTKKIASSWERMFKSDLFGPMEKSIIDRIEKMIKEVEDAAPAESKDRFKAQSQLSVYEAKVSVKAIMSKVKKQMSKEQKKISRCIAPHVRDALLDGYKSAAEEKGKGSVARQKAFFHRYVEVVKDQVFSNLSHSILERLDNAANSIRVNLDDALESLAKKVEVSMSVLWECSEDSAEQHQLREELVQKVGQFSKLVQMWQEAADLRSHNEENEDDKGGEEDMN